MKPCRLYLYTLILLVFSVLLQTRRLKMFTAIGRFIGLSLWFSNTVPLNFSRHVVKFLLERYWLLCLSFKYFGSRYAINFLLKHSMGLLFELCLFILGI